MSYNNSVSINDCITDLQTLDDYNVQIQQLKNLLAECKMKVSDKEELQAIINIMTMKNSKQKDTVHTVANTLNRMNVY